MTDCTQIFLPAILIAVFFTILFLQSGIDKVVNYKSEFNWLNTHFSKSILSNIVWLMFPVLTGFELLTGLLNLVASLMIFFSDCFDIYLLYANICSAITLLLLFFGQRMAKDYAGAANITGYFIAAIIGIYLCT